MNDDLIGEIREAEFRTTGLRAGYDVDEVDRFLDELIAAVGRGEDVSGLVDQARFSPVKRKGYEMSEVDALLDRIAGRPTGRALRNALDPVPRELRSGGPPEVVRKQPGLLGRLFGRQG